MQAIETHYNGYKFRSRLEARWAVFLDAARKPYSYEAEGYKLESGYYLPDFWLPEDAIFLEIKAKRPNDREYLLARDLAKESQQPVLVISGQPWHDQHKVYLFDGQEALVIKDIWQDGPLLGELAKCRNCNAFVFVGVGDFVGCVTFWCADTCSCEKYRLMEYGLRGPCETARQARFEHGAAPTKLQVQCNG